MNIEEKVSMSETVIANLIEGRMQGQGQVLDSWCAVKSRHSSS